MNRYVVYTLLALSVAMNVWLLIERRRNEGELAEEVTMMRARLRAANDDVKVASQGRAAAEKDIDVLLGAVKGSATPAPLQPDTITPAMHEARWKRAEELLRSGDIDGAMREFLWCYANADASQSALGTRGAMRVTFARLAKTNLSAQSALRQLRDNVEALAMNTRTPEHLRESLLLSDALGDRQRGLALFDSLSVNDPNRRAIAPLLFDEFIAAKRYEDAIKAKPLGTLLNEIDGWSRNAQNYKDAEDRHGAISKFARSVEALAAQGKLVEAKLVAKKILEVDNSPAALAALRKHAEAAGQGSLLDFP